jgi:hypothetical protein
MVGKTGFEPATPWPPAKINTILICSKSGVPCVIPIVIDTHNDTHLAKNTYKTTLVVTQIEVNDIINLGIGFFAEEGLLIIEVLFLHNWRYIMDFQQVIDFIVTRLPINSILDVLVYLLTLSVHIFILWFLIFFIKSKIKQHKNKYSRVDNKKTNAISYSKKPTYYDKHKK